MDFHWPFDSTLRRFWFDRVVECRSIKSSLVIFFPFHYPDIQECKTVLLSVNMSKSATRYYFPQRNPLVAVNRASTSSIANNSMMTQSTHV
ncbi:hypothetical protein RCL_jg24404.t1 [Rhizophagus clarus]|uniref:Uncharacterized protein n=1 Tax=Rhizophagus clarus TaxID=94130 RepID=A0A8H3R5F7_9GLOM|nr:hypothetical protein RCL_jg24404.t1 [Rhizophagus clarus]